MTGGGTYANSAGTATVSGTIVAGNTGGDLLGTFSGTNNLIEDDAGESGLSSPENILNENPLLASSLANNGGPSETIALLSGSPAMGANITLDDPHGNPITTDERGDVRSVATPDIGAYDESGGTGLLGEYFFTQSLIDPDLTETDATVNLDSLPDPNLDPHPGTDSNPFSVRWTGLIQAPVSGTYTFYTNASGGARLWVDGTELVNNWNNSGVSSGTIDLVASEKYQIEMDYHCGQDNPLAQLFWAVPGQSEELIPQSALYAESLPPPPPSDVTANVFGSNAVQLNWTDNTFGQAQYTIERADFGSSDFETIAVLDPGTTTYADTGLISGDAYQYRVLATSTVGNSLFVTVSTPTLPPTAQNPTNLVVYDVAGYTPEQRPVRLVRDGFQYGSVQPNGDRTREARCSPGIREPARSSWSIRKTMIGRLGRSNLIPRMAPQESSNMRAYPAP